MSLKKITATTAALLAIGGLGAAVAAPAQAAPTSAPVRCVMYDNNFNVGATHVTDVWVNGYNCADAGTALTAWVESGAPMQGIFHNYQIEFWAAHTNTFMLTLKNGDRYIQANVSGIR